MLLPLAASQDCLKGLVNAGSTSAVSFLSLLSGATPLAAVLDNPVGQSGFKTDVTASLFRLKPLVLEDFITFRLELPIQRGVPQQIVS
jgi:hypothetical protein